MQLLYIEDNPLNAKVLQLYAKKLWGTTLDISTTAEEGLSKLETDDYDLLYLDLNLPKMDGIEALRLIRESAKNKGLPVLIVSADASDETVSLANKTGANSYLTKPVDLEQLKQQTEGILKHLNIDLN